MGGIPGVCSDPLFGIDPSTGEVNRTLDDILACEDGPAETRETGTVEPAPSPEVRSSGAARDAARLREMSRSAHSEYVADFVPADSMHPAGAPRDIRFGSVSVDAWEVEGPEYAGARTGDMVFHGVEHRTPYRVLVHDGRTFLINDAQNDSGHHVDMITRAAERGRSLAITDRVL
jgi:hypothetical protein